MSDTRIKADVSIEKVLFFKDNWGIISCSVDREIEGKVQLGRFNNACFKGQMPELKQGQMCTVIADFVHDGKYGDQYNIVSIWDRIDFAETDDRGKKKYLASLFTEKQVNMMYEALDDPFMALKNHDMESLIKIKGCGLKTANLWVRRFDMSYKRAKIYIELEGYDLTNNMIDRLLKTYGSPDLVIDKVKNNPYILVNEVEGIGWSKADDIAIAGGVDPLGVLRIKEYIKYYLNQCGKNGMSWVTTDQLLGAILDNVSEDVADEDITAAIRELGDKLWCSDDKQRIGLKKYHILAENIAKELLRIRDAEFKFKYDGWEQRVKNLEDEQGWSFTDEQKNGIEIGLKNNVLLIHAAAGCGKSTLVTGILTALPNYSHVMCALSGRASARLAEITGETGYTIHRLLGYPKGNPEYQYFVYNQDKQLGYDIYILDEISMVDAKMFYYLIRAIPSGAKLIMLGDVSQLESIGCGNVAYDMIHSDEIADVLLTKIHRQSAKSAIVTDSLAIRTGNQIVDKDWSGIRTDGELKDLILDCYLDKTNSYYKVMEYFQRIRTLKDFNIMETQILVPVKKRGSANTYNLNNDIQELYNPASKNKKEESVMTISSGLRIFRVGDKIMNTQNNYKVNPPIFNGNIGMIKDITIKEDEETGEDIDIMIVDFVGIGRVEIPKEYWNQLDLGYAMTAHKCVTKNTYVLSDQGMLPITKLNKYSDKENIIKNIGIYNGSECEQPSHFYDVGQQECRRIRTKRGFQVTGTLDHGLDVLCKDGRIYRKNIEDIQLDDYLVLSKNTHIYGNNTNLPEEWYDLHPDVRSAIYNLPKQLNKDFAQFLGHMVADGCICSGSFRCAKNQKEVIEEFAEITRRLFHCPVNVKKLIDGPMGGMYQAEIFSQYIKEFLLKIDGLSPRGKNIPSCIMTAPEEIQCSFLKGLFEDGTVNLKGDKFDHIEIVQTSYGQDYNLLYKVHMMLLNMGITSCLRTKVENDQKTVCALYIYRNDAKVFRDKIGFISLEKRQRLDKACYEPKHVCSSFIIPYIKPIMKNLVNKYNIELSQKIKKQLLNTRNVTYYFLKKYLTEIKDDAGSDADYLYLVNILNYKLFERVVDIKDNIYDNVYCIEMPKTHKFVQNGFDGWNCQGSEFDNVIFCFDFDSYSLLTRQLVYTGITRAKKKCYLTCQTSALRYATAQEAVSQKQTHLQECLYEVAHPKLVF